MQILHQAKAFEFVFFYYLLFIFANNFPSERRQTFQGPSCQTLTKKRRNWLLTMRILITKVTLQAQKSCDYTNCSCGFCGYLSFSR